MLLIPPLINNKVEPDFHKKTKVKHAYTTTSTKQRIMSFPMPFPIQSLLYETTTCLKRPATTFVPQVKKKTCLKQPLQNFIQQRNGKQCIKSKCLSDYIYFIATL